MCLNNLFNDAGSSSQEIFQRLVCGAGFELERIVSTGQATPAGEWLVSERSEWVLLLSGSAAIRFEGDDTTIELQVGDYLIIGALRRHRVEWTAPAEPTLWLALHFDHEQADRLW